MKTVAVALGLVGVLSLGGLAAPAVAEASESGSIRGRVVSASDPRVKGITVALWTVSGTRIATTKTNSNGRYKFTGLKARTYTVKFQDMSDDGLLMREAPVHYSSEWLGGVRSRNNADRITLSSGELVNDANTELWIYSTVSGKLFLNGDRAKYSDHIRVVISTTDGKVIQDATSGATIETGLKPGRYRMRYSSTDGSFPAKYAVDPTDGDTVFSLNGVNRVKGIIVKLRTNQ